MKQYYGFSDLYGNKEYQIEIYSFSMNEKVAFAAFINDFNDSFKSNWTSQEIYGRMDPISTFKNTSRTINMSFDIHSYDLPSAKGNLINLDLIIKGLYPVYTEDSRFGVSTITAPPLFRVHVSNLICNVVTNDGLLGYLNGFDFKPDMSFGQIIQDGIIYPKLVKASLSFSVIHEHPLGSKIVGGKHVPRIEVKEGFSKAFAHRYDGGLVAAEKPKTPADAKPSNERDLYVLRLAESGPTAAERGRIYAVGNKSFTGESSGPPERFKLVNTTDKYKVYKSSDGQIVGIPIVQDGKTPGFTTTPKSTVITETQIFR